MLKNDIFKMCLNNLKRRKARTFLTVLGVFIGCCSIVIMVSLGIGMKESQERMLKEMGDLTIITVSTSQGGKGTAKLDDAAVSKFKRVEGIETVTPKLSLDSYSIKLYAGVGNRFVSTWVTVVGMDKESIGKLGYNLISGAILSGKSGEAVAGQYLAYNFEDTLRPSGANTVDRWSGYDENGNELAPPDPYFDTLKTPMTLEIDTGNNKITFPINAVGRIKEDYSKGYETSEGLIISIEDAKELIKKAQGGSTKPIAYSSVLVKVKDISQVADVEKEIKSLGFNTSSMESIRQPMEKEARQKQLMLGGLGGISLLVAALGITNTMIMSISERTREIGIMKALGCYVRDIRIMFLTEAGAIGLIGGLIGSLVSFLASVTINLFSMGESKSLAGAIVGGEGISRVSIVPLWLLAFAVVFSIFIGLISGYYPANKAVKIPALEAIKNE